MVELLNYEEVRPVITVITAVITNVQMKSDVETTLITVIILIKIVFSHILKL